MGSNILRKIDNLLKLSRANSNVHEATLAAARAREIAEKYNIAMEMLSEKNLNVAIDSIIDFEKFYERPFKSGLATWEQGLMKVIAEHYNCRVFFSGRWCERDLLNIVGRSSDIEMANSMYCWLQRQLAMLILRDGTDKEQDWQDAYLFGATHQVQYKFDEAKEKARSSMSNLFKEDAQKAIIKLNDRIHEVDEFLKDKNLINEKAEANNIEAFNMGYYAATSVNLEKEPKLND